MKSKVWVGLSLAGLGMLASCSQESAVTPYQQLQEDIIEIDAYLATNPPDPDDIIVRDASGIRLVITEQGTGTLPPSAYNIIQVAYAGRVLYQGDLSDPFDQTDEGEVFTFTLTSTDTGPDVIAGWKNALYMMTEGTQATVYIPSILAYGTNGTGSIPGNAILAFDLDLKVVNTSNQEPQLTTDIAKISTYLEENQISNVQVDPSGLHYVIEEEGTGDSPGLYDHVKIRYTAKVMDTAETVFEDNVLREPDALFSSRVVNYINGKKIGLQKMRPGGKATFYIPSALGFGRTAIGVVPANSVLIYEVELLEVTPNQE